MAHPRISCLNTSIRSVQRSTGARAPFSSSTVARAVNDPSRRTAAAGLLASQGDHLAPYSASRPPKSVPQPLDSIRLPAGAPRPSNAPTSAGAERIASLISGAQARRARQGANQGRRPGQPSPTTVQELEKAKKAAELTKQITRRWRAGDVYAPHDLSSVEMTKWKARGRPTHDVFDILNFNPKESYRNFSIMSEYITPMGRIKHASETGLRPVNQRRISRAIRRSIGIGMMPSIHRHPEILQKIAVRTEQLSPVTKGQL